MNDDDFEKAVAELIETERKKARDKEPYYIEPLEAERAMIVKAFQDHYDSLSSFQDIETVEDILADGEDEADYFSDGLGDDPLSRNSLILALNELIQRDVERVPIPTAGEMHIQGEGIYMFEPNDDEDTTDTKDFGCDILEDGAFIIGTIGWYSAAPTIPYATFLQTQQGSDFEEMPYDDMPTEMPGLWVALHDTKIYDGTGREVKKYDRIVVPLDYPSLHFGKVMRQGEPLKKMDEVHIDIAVHFKGDFIREQFTNAENDLNYNDYSPEEHRSYREEHQDELGIYMSGIDPDEKIILSAFHSIATNGEERQLNECGVYYLQPVFVKPQREWRVAHAFCREEDGVIGVIHILPEDILAIRRENEK